MRSLLVIEAPPSLNFIPCVLQAQKPIFVQALLAQSFIEAFHNGIVCGLAWSAEVQLNTFFISQLVHHFTDELAPIIDFDRHRFASVRHDDVQHPNDVFDF